jgi:hypothetical protein
MAIKAAAGVEAALTRQLGLALQEDMCLQAYKPYARHFAFDALRKLLLTQAGTAIGLLYQQQQQGKQLGVKPYHQQLLAELGVVHDSRWLDASPLVANMATGSTACCALTFAMEMRAAAAAAAAAV